MTAPARLAELRACVVKLRAEHFLLRTRTTSGIRERCNRDGDPMPCATVQVLDALDAMRLENEALRGLAERANDAISGLTEHGIARTMFDEPDQRPGWALSESAASAWLRDYAKIKEAGDGSE